MFRLAIWFPLYTTRYVTFPTIGDPETDVAWVRVQVPLQEDGVCVGDGLPPAWSVALIVIAST